MTTNLTMKDHKRVEKLIKNQLPATQKFLSIIKNEKTT